MKILQFTPYFPPHKGGLQIVAANISKYLTITNNVDVINITSSIGQSLDNDNPIYWNNHKIGYMIDNYKVIVIPSFEIIHNYPLPKIWTKNFWIIIGYIKYIKADIIQTHTRFFIQTLMGGLISKIFKIKRVHVEHGSGFVTGYSWYIIFFSRLFDWIIGLWIFRQCDQIITISNMNKQFIKKFTNKEVKIIYNPVEYNSKEKIQYTIPHIGFVGRLVSLKGVDLLIDALSQIQDIKRKCTIVGTGDKENTLKSIVQKMGLSDRIIFVGADDRSKRLHKFDIFVNPSYQEGLPTTVVEALMAKCIVVATDVGGTREISDKNDLILINTGDSQKLRDGLILAFDSLDKSGLSYERVNERFGTQEAIRQYNNILSHKVLVGKIK